MDNSTDCTGFFTQNTDITGIGVRVAFYVQMVVIELQTWFKVGEEDILNACWVLISMSFGLMLAAIVAATQNQLSFYNAVQVQNLVSLTQVTLLCVGNSLIWGTESGGLMHWTRRKKWRHNAIVMCLLCSQYFLGGGLLTYLWVKGQRFGPNPECISSMHFYVSAWRLRGSDPFRNAKIAAFTIYISLVLGPVCQNLFMYTAVRVQSTPTLYNLDSQHGLLYPAHGAAHQAKLSSTIRSCAMDIWADLGAHSHCPRGRRAAYRSLRCYPKSKMGRREGGQIRRAEGGRVG
ncbi:hypothetical protein PsYK624_102180 [Phanerochaete sordida]|uniref:Uncharacterized protein n=1 Tax=Phanerochaete sordida TaxID=48140 RepID=A0A9P3GI21_9APHY|nr:hypothetical protein PsYK624_102180 [Phanerochaete sordida]